MRTVNANRAILLTAPGTSALAVVRLIGPKVHQFLQQHFSRAVSPARAVHGTLKSGDAVIDDPVVVLAPDRTWADISLHGGPWVVRATLDLAERCGFEIVQQS